MPDASGKAPLVTADGEKIESNGDEQRTPNATTTLTLDALTKGHVHVTFLSDFIARRLDELEESQTQERFEGLQETLAEALIQTDLTGDGEVTYDDVLAFDPTKPEHLNALTFDYQAALDEVAPGCDCSIRSAYAEGNDDKLVTALDEVFEDRIEYELPDAASQEGVAKIRIALPKGGGTATIDATRQDHGDCCGQDRERDRARKHPPMPASW
jgi:hypothetical protein